MEFTKTEDGKYQLSDGRIVSRAEVIRELFSQNWKRADIAKHLDVPYNVVFQATANMTNAHHAPGKGGVAAPKMITLPDGTQMPRAEYIRQQVAAGRSRAEIAKELGISPSAVWSATKDMKGSRRAERHYVKLDDGTEIPRNEYIRKRFLEGATRREIANELGCDYTVVWQATKAITKKDEEKAEATADTIKPELEVIGATAEDNNDGGSDLNFPE